MSAPRHFVHESAGPRVLFGPGVLRQVGEEVGRIGTRALLISGRSQERHAAVVADVLGAALVARVNDVVEHVPAAVAAAAVTTARDSGADVVCCMGGGSAIGLAKAIALDTDLPFVAVPTTYAGSEMTPIWGLSESGVKTTGHDVRVLPRTVVYDPLLTLSLPPATTAASGMNALAHCVEGLYARDASPLLLLTAEEGIRVLADALPRCVTNPGDLDARTGAQYGAWLAGWVLGAVGMGVHHRLCHVLGGRWRLPHAETHAALLPYVTRFNSRHADDAMRRIERALAARREDAAGAVWDLGRQMGLHASLTDLGLPPDAVGEAAKLVAAGLPDNPRPVDEAGIRDLLEECLRQQRPARAISPRTDRTEVMIDELTAEVVQRFSATPDPRLRDVMQSMVRHLHGLAREVALTDAEWLAGIRFLTSTGQMSDDLRQEFILLSDTLGLTSLVDLLDHGSDDPRATPPTILGPFYAPDSPWREYGASMATYDDHGQPAVVRGRVLSTDGRPLAGAVLDVWQSAATGFYAVQQPVEQGLGNLRGRYRTHVDGRYEIRTVRPVPYPIPADGPVGKLLRATARHPMRAAHIHVILTADGFRPLTTHVFDASSDYLDSDAVFGVKEALVRDFVIDEDGVAVCEHDFILVPRS